MYYGIAGIISMGLTGLFWWSHSGPYRWIADFRA